MNSEQIRLYSRDKGPNTDWSRGQSHWVVWGGNAMTVMLFSRAASRNPNVSCEECESSIIICGRLSPQCRKK